MSRVASLLVFLPLIAGVAGCGASEEPAGGRMGAELVPIQSAAPATGQAPSNPIQAAPIAAAESTAPAAAEAPRFDIVIDRAALEKTVGKPAVINFDDLKTFDSGETPFEPDRYRGQGIVIRGEGGQYVGRSFGYPNDYVPVSKPNAYAAGPPAARGDKLGAGGKETVVTFVDKAGKPAAVAGFGADFVDVDYPSSGKCALIAFDASGREVARSEGFQGSSGKPTFVGVRSTDPAGKPLAAIASIKIVAGSGWPGTDANEGVVLDDFTFSPPAAAGTFITPSTSPPATLAQTDRTPANSAGTPAPPQSSSPGPSSPPAAQPPQSIDAKFVEGPGGRTDLAAPTPRKIDDIAYSPDGKRLVSVADTNESILWDLADRTAKQLVPSGAWNNRLGGRVKFTADGRHVFVGSLGRADQFDAATGRLLRTFGKDGGVTSGPLLVSPDGRTVVTAAEDRDGVEHYTVWYADKPEPVAEFRHTPDAGYTTTAFLTPDGATAGVLDRKAGVRLFDTATGAERKGIGTPDRVDDAALSLDGRFVATVDANWAVRFWDISRRDAPPRILREAPVQSTKAPVFSPDGATIAIFANKANNWGLFDTQTGTQRGAISADTPLFVSADGKTFVAGKAVTDAAGRVRTTLDQVPYVAAVAPDGSAVAVAGDRTGLTVFPLASSSAGTIELAATVPLGTNRVERGSVGFELRLGIGGHYAAAGDGHGRLFAVVDLKAGKSASIGAGPAWTFGSDGHSLYAGGNGDSWYFVGGQLRHVELKDFLARGEKTVVAQYRGMAISPDGKTLAAGVQKRRSLDGKINDAVGRLVFLDPRKNPDDIAIVGTLAERFVPALLTFSPDSRRLAADDGQKLRLWELASASGKPEERPNAFQAGAYGMWFTSDGNSLVTYGGREDASVWDVETGQLGRKFFVKAGHVESVWGLAVSPAAPLYATFGGRGELLLKSLSDDAVLARTTAGDGPLVAGAFTSDGKSLGTLGSKDGKDVVQVWALPSVER